MDERERQYREYLALRQHEQEREIAEESYGRSAGRNEGRYFAEDINRTRPKRQSIEDTPYGASDMKRRQKEKERRDREMAEYLAAREADRNRRGVRTGVRYSEDKKNRKARAKANAKARARYEKTRHERTAHDRPRRERRPLLNRRQTGKKSRKKPMRIAVVILLVLVLGFAATGIGGIVMALSALGSMEHISVEENNIAINPSVEAQLDGYTNIVVLGIDARADEDDSQCRSDAIIVASINEETNEVKMFSVYRDTMLDVGDEGLDKITHAYFYGGAEQTLYALNKNLDLNIDKVVVVNWKTVADVIDSVGGIEVDIQESEINEMNHYIPNTAKNVDGPDDLIEGPGKQTLNGVQAVTYARIRKDAATGDYRRNERMKIVFKETFKKVKNSGFFSMFNVARKAMPEIKTNMGAGDILGMMIKFKSYDMTDSTTGFPYDVDSWTGYGAAGYAWYGPPKNLANNVSKLHEQFFDQQGYVPTDTVQQISNDISYKTGIY
ncbi:MAG: LCP family protein [Bacillota bacterium]|nr:LCP family protein [Bacillota bacterium]